MQRNIKCRNEYPPISMVSSAAPSSESSDTSTKSSNISEKFLYIVLSLLSFLKQYQSFEVGRKLLKEKTKLIAVTGRFDNTNSAAFISGVN